MFPLLLELLQAKAPQDGEFTVNYLSHVLCPESMLNKEVTLDDKRLCLLTLHPANSVKAGAHIQAITILSLLFLFFVKYALEVFDS